ncbi:uncharacterized protein [Maniola hyperantus]|uniref:uncharacterized protein isoform X2 n=1 Tax=Aphantopus hyperantus TaxID=2795564 RepID=UPI0037486A84
MGHQCTVCFSSSRKNKDVSFFVYPRDPEKHRWLKAVGREDLIVKLNDPNARKHNKICERHFDKDCLKITKCTKHLTENAYPTLKIPSIDDEACTSTLRREVITEINNQNNNYENIAVDIGKKITILSDQTTRSVQVGLTNSRIILKKISKTQGITFHSFPLNELRRIRWVDIVRKQRRESSWRPTSASKICSIHFEDEDKYTSGKGLTLLKKSALPVLQVPNASQSTPASPSSLAEDKMVRNYKRKTTDKYKRETLLEAVKAVQERRMTPYKAALVFGVPRPTILSRVKGERGLRSVGRGKPPVFTPDLEKKIVSMLIDKETTGHCLSQREARNLVGQFARDNHIATPFKDGIPGQDWITRFKERNNLSIKMPQAVDATNPCRLVFNQAVGDEQPSTSAGEELQYQASRYSMLSGNDGNQSALEEIIIKEEITDEERYQCRLCLSVGRKMQELGEYAPLYRKLLFENNYQNTTIPSFMYQMLACWECHAELRKVKRFQDKVRRANNAFETSQNQKCENLSNLSTILIGEYKNSQPGGTDQPSSVEDCAQGIKEEAVEVEVEETALPDPLEVSQVKPSDQEFDINLEIQKETNPSVSTEKVAKRTIPEQTPNILKRAKLDQTVPKPGPKRAKLDQSGQKPAQEEESEPKSTPESDADAIFGKVKIEIDELQKILQERRNKESFKSMKFKCDSCVLGFTDHNRLLEHNKNFHDEEVGTCECDICERRFDDEDQLSAHHRNHFVKFVCKLCNFECYTKTGRAIHFKRHKGALQGTSLEDLLKKKLTSNQRASASGSSHKTST